jgi:hypothetical protein
MYDIIITDKYKTGEDKEGGKSYVEVVYVILSDDARPKWLAALKLSTVRVIPPE